MPHILAQYQDYIIASRDGKLQRSVCFAQDMTSGIPEFQSPADPSPSIDCPEILCCLFHLVSPIPEVHREPLYGSILKMRRRVDRQACNNASSISNFKFATVVFFEVKQQHQIPNLPMCLVFTSNESISDGLSCS